MSSGNLDEVMDILYQGKDMSDIGKGLESKENMKAQRVVKTSNEMANYETPKFMLHAARGAGGFWNYIGNCIDDTTHKIPIVWRISTNFLTIFGVLSLCYFSTALISPTKLYNGSLEGLTGVKDESGNEMISASEEKLIMEDIGKYCFNKIPMYNDGRMCATTENLLTQRLGKFEREINVYQNAAIETDKQTFETAKEAIQAKVGKTEGKG